MRLLANRDTRLLMVFIITLCTASCIVVGAVSGVVLCCVCATSYIAILIAVIVFMNKRNRIIDGMSNDIDKILHGIDVVSLECCEEGEISVLQNEIHKMTIHLVQQAEMLKTERQYLADSLADVSHQIRTPLTSMNLIISLISKSDITEEKRIELIYELRSLLSRLDWLVSVLLKISKFDAKTVSFSQEKVSVCEIISSACEPLLIPMELREQKLIVDVPKDAIFIGDMNWSTEAVGNILKNCMEHTPNGGELKISAVNNALFCEIVIEDTGHGIHEDDIRHIFDRFYRGKDSASTSVGIGLALAKMIINRQNGTVKAENHSNGARFTIRFNHSIV